MLKDLRHRFVRLIFERTVIEDSKRSDMIPPFDGRGCLPPGIHWATWEEITEHFGTSPYRRTLLAGMKRALNALKVAHCQTVYLDGSFVTAKDVPGDFDACWSLEGVIPELLDPVLLNFENLRAAQKTKYYGELFPADFTADIDGRTFIEFFQNDKDTGQPKGIIALDLGRLP